MEVIIKSFIGVFCLMLLTVTGIGITSTSVSARNANAFLTASAERIETAHFAEDVIEACQADAREMDYDLSVEVYRPGGSKQAAYGSMTLTYDYGISFFDLENTRRIAVDLW